MNLMEKAMGMLNGAIDPQITQEAKSEAGKYSPDINGLKQAVGARGGMVIVDRACEFVKTHPKIAGMLKMANIDVEQVRRQLNENTPPMSQAKKSQQNNSSGSSYRDRLSRLK